jgi:two-component system, NarL family, nitrate/nitrite response regulator NarL
MEAYEGACYPPLRCEHHVFGGNTMDPGRDASTPARASVIVLGDIRLYREGLALTLSSRGFLCVAEAATPSEGLGKVRTLRPDIAIVDVASRAALEVIGGLRQEPRRPKILVVAVDEDTTDVIECAEAGADGYVTQAATLEDLERAIDHVGQEELLCSPRIAATLFRCLAHGTPRVADLPADGALTHRERQIWTCIGQGLSNKEIAGALNISVLTVKNHVHHLLHKLNVSTRSQAASRLSVASRRLAPRQGWNKP